MNSPEKITPLYAHRPSPLDGSLDPAIVRRERRLKGIGIGAVLALFVGLGFWSAYAPLDSAAIGPGVIVLENYRVAIDHLEGGIVQEVKAREGQFVKKGDLLLTLQDV